MFNMPKQEEKNVDKDIETVQEVDHKKELQDHIKNQIEDQKKIDEMVSGFDAIDKMSNMLYYAAKKQRLDKMASFLEEEGVSYDENKLKEKSDHYIEKVKALKNETPKAIDNMIEEMTHKHLLTFIDEALSFHKNQSFKLLLTEFNDEQKDKIYELLKEEEITDRDHENSVAEFERTLGYSTGMIGRIVKEMDETVSDDFLAFIQKYVKDTRFLKAQVDQFKELEDMNLSDKMVERYGKSICTRFRIHDQGEDVLKEAYQDITAILKNFSN